MISGINRTYKPNIKHIYYYSQSKNPVAIKSVNLEIVPEYLDSLFSSDIAKLHRGDGHCNPL